jgi:hypothetical protein
VNFAAVKFPAVNFPSVNFIAVNFIAVNFIAVSYGELHKRLILCIEMPCSGFSCGELSYIKYFLTINCSALNLPVMNCGDSS